MQSSAVVESVPAIGVAAAPRSRSPGATHPSRDAVLLSVYLAVMGTFVVVGAFAPLLAPQSPDAQQLTARLRPPIWLEGGTWANPLGTDSLGRDQLSRLLYGDRISLIVVLTTVPLSTAIGTLLGVLAGYHSRVLDATIMRLVDIQLALPAILFAVMLAAVFGPSLKNVLIVIVLFGWAGYARVVRGEVHALREREFIVAARTSGGGGVWIMRKHLLPNLLNTIIVLATLDIAFVILIEAALSFLGVGVPITTPSWGRMVADGANFITIAWWLVTVPGLAILVVSLTANLLGDWCRDALDPHLRHAR
jgi:peptide/nickel transport system permease protein